MFEVGFSEILIIAVVALLVLGPERLPKAARMAGLWARKARAQWFAVKLELERELAAEELRGSLENPLAELGPELQALEKTLDGDMRELRRELRDSVDKPPPAAP